MSASVGGNLSSSLGGLTSLITSVGGLKTSVSGKASLDATSSGKATFGGSGTIVNGATIALVNTPVAAAARAASKEPPAEGSPFTDPTVTPQTSSISGSAIDNATATAGGFVPAQTPGEIIGRSVSDGSYLNNVIYGPTSYNWTNASQITQSMSVVNPSFAQALQTDLQNGLASVKDFGTKLGTDLYNQSGIPALEKSYVDAGARIDTAIATGKLSDYSKAASASVDVIGKGAQVGVSVSSLNKDIINAKDFVSNSCLVQKGKDWVDSVTQPLQDGWDKIKQDMKDVENKIKDMDPKLKDRLSELRKSIDSFDEKALDEFVNANHKDQACKFCAEEAAEKLKNGVERKIVSDGVSNCLYREYSAFKTTYASKIPITDKTASNNLKNNC
jgi:hypothetical protein